MSDGQMGPAPDEQSNELPAEPATEASDAISEREPITGQVARILTTRELVINRGSSDGVRKRMIFEVLDPKGEDITDPDTGAVLGSIDRPKIRVRVTDVEHRFSVARTYEYTSQNVGGYGSAFGNLLEPMRFRRTYKTLKTSETTWEDLDESESFVKTGDPVREVIEPERDE
jgi:hypothetical protein